MVASKLDLINENAAEIGSSYEITIELCGTDDLTLFSGVSQIKTSVQDTTILLSPTVTVIDNRTFKLSIAFGDYPTNLNAGNYTYDVLFYNTTKRFYAVEGKFQIIRRVTAII